MIEVYIDGRSFNDEGCGFSIILRGQKNIWVRGLLLEKTTTTNQADLLAIKFGLLSIKSLSEDIHIIFRNKYLDHVLMREGTEWKKKDLEKNKELIEEVRGLISARKVTLHHDPDHEIFKSLLKKTESMVREKKPYVSMK